MKNILIILVVALFPFMGFSQNSDKLGTTEYAVLQSQEIVNYYKLDFELAKQIEKINLLCAEKVRSLQADTQMPIETIEAGIQFNMEERERSVKNLLTLKQLEWFNDFQRKSIYNQPVN